MRLMSKRPSSEAVRPSKVQSGLALLNDLSRVSAWGEEALSRSGESVHTDDSAAGPWRLSVTEPALARQVVLISYSCASMFSP